MTNSQVCLVCSQPSQTDIDGKGNGKRKMKGCDVVQSQLRSMFLLRKLLKVSNSTCVELLTNNGGSNPSSWFSCCWTCFTIIMEAEKVFNELIKLEKQWKNLKTEFQTKLQTSCEIKLKTSESVISEEKKIDITVRTIRDEALKRNNLLNGFTVSHDPEEEQLNCVKIEVNEETDAELATHLSNNSIYDEPAIEVPKAFCKSKLLRVQKSAANIPKRTRSGRLVKPRISIYESASACSSDEEKDLSDNDDSGHKSESDNQEEWCTENKSKKIESYFSPKNLNKKELLENMANPENEIKCKHCGVEFINKNYRILHETSAHGMNGNEQTQDVLNSQEDSDSKNESTHITPRNSKPSSFAHTRIKRNKTRIFKTPIFRCKFCSMQFSNAKRRYAHAVSAHESRYKLQCNHCNGKYSSLEYLNFHLRRFHKGKINPDPSCKLMVEMPTRRTIITKKHPTLAEKKWKCKHCNEEFLDPMVRRDHQITVHEKLYFQCNHCLKKFVAEQHLYKHLKRIHMGKINPDPNCTLRVKTKYDSRKKLGTCKKVKSKVKKDKPTPIHTTHTRVVKTPTSKCNHCTQEFPNPTLRDAHLIHAHENVYSLHCNHCNKKYLRLNYRNMHLRNYHNGKINPDPSCTLVLPAPPIESKKKDPVMCEECNYDYITEGRLQKHIAAVHRKERNFICEICSQSFTNKQSLKVHQDFKHGDSEALKSLQCEECGRILGDRQTLRKHIKVVHRKEFQFHCPICKVGYQCQSYLDRHIFNVHTDVPKPFVCNICQKSYGANYKLKQHMRTHTGECPFKCSFCDKSFISKFRMTRHEKSLHVKERLFQCEQCGSRFPSQHYLNSHVYSTHNKKKSSIPPKKIVEKHELLKYIESANKSFQEKSCAVVVGRNNKNKVGLLRRHMEQHLKQNGLLHNGKTENSTEKKPCTKPQTFE